MPKAKNKRIRHEEDSGQKQQQLATDLENHGDQEESCGALETTKYSILEKIASFFEDRPFFYDIQNDQYKNKQRRDAELLEFAAGIGMDRK